MTFRHLSVVIALCLLSTSVLAQDIRLPATLPVSRQGVVVFEFESPDSTRYGRSIARLVAHTIASKLDGVEGVHVMNIREPMEPISRNPGNVSLIANKKNAVMALWGEYYREGDNVLVIPHLQILPRDKMDDRDLGLVYVTAEGMVSAAPPATQVNFSPIMLTPADLARLHVEYPESAPMWTTEAIAGQTTLLLPDSMEYSITRMADSSQRIVTPDGSGGWVRTAKRPVDAFTQIALYTQSISRYLAGDYDGAKTGFAGYIAAAQRDQDAMNLAFAHVLVGNSSVLGARQKSLLPDHDAAEREYQAAADLVPESPSPYDHLAVSRLHKFTGPGAVAATDTVPELNSSEIDLIHNVQRDDNPQTVQNLRVFYKLANKYKYLKKKGDDEMKYSQSLNEQLGVLAQIDRKQEFVLILQEKIIRPDFLDIRGGAWYTKDVSKTFTFNDTSYTSEKISQAQAYGIDFHNRQRMAHPLYGDFTIGVWYTTYEFTRTALIDDLNAVEKAKSWAVLVPIHLGLSVTPFPDTFIQPYGAVGVGGVVAVSVLNTTLNSGTTEESNKVQGAFAGYIGVGADLFITPTFGFSVGAKYEFVNFKNQLLTMQKTLTGLQLLAGFATRI